MDNARFEQMVARLEAQSAQAPGWYRVKVALLAVLGFGVLLLLLGGAGIGLLLLIGGLGVALYASGGKGLGLLLQLGFKALVLLAAPLWLLLKSSSRALFTRLAPPQGRVLQRDEAPALFEALGQMRQRMRGPRFHQVLLTDELNAAVVQRPMFGLVGWPRNYLLLGLPLLESLSPDEALAVVAHEYGHLAGSHSHFAAFIYRLRTTWGTIQQVSQQWNGVGGRLLQRVVGWYAPYFNAYTFVLARANEYQADLASVELVGSAVAASALKRVNLGLAAYDHFMEDTFAGARLMPAPPADLAERWAARAHQLSAEEQAAAWLQRALAREPQVHDTHPALKLRLRALPGLAANAAAIEALPQPLHGATAAQAWLGPRATSLRDELQRQWHDAVSPRWREHHDEWQRRRNALDALNAVEQPSAAQQLERLQLMMQLQPDTDHLPALAAYNAEHGDQALGLYLEGGLRLDRDDEQGLDLLERAMALDGEAIRPACEKAYAYLKPRNDPRADQYAERWTSRQRMEAERAAQARALSPDHVLREPSELSPQAWQTVRELLAPHARGIAKAYLARRVLPVDPTVDTYVLCIDLTTTARLCRREAEIVQRLAALEWPVHLFICTLSGRFQPFEKRLAQLPGTRLM